MTTIGRRRLVTLLLGALVLLTAAVPAMATHRRPGSGTPFRVAMVPNFRQCVAPNDIHKPPLDYAACSQPGPRITSEILTMSPRGVASGFFKAQVYCTDGGSPPCNPANATDTEDVSLRLSQTDVLCAVGGVLGCTAAGADYTGPLVMQLALRITDHANGSPAGATCATAQGGPPCVPATVQDKTFGWQVGCAATAGANGAQCVNTTTMDTLVPGFVKEQQIGVVSLLSINAYDMGPDGAVGGLCPPTCGTGDETPYLSESVFLP